MKVSIITSTFNSGLTLQNTINSIQNQSYTDIEYIIIDGVSTDDTVEIIKKNVYINRYISEPDKGIYDALNKGIGLATGDIIGFVHSDDVLANNNIISELVRCFKKEQCDGVYGDLEYVNKTDISKVFRYWRSCTFNTQLLKKGWMPAHPTLYLKKDIYNRFGGFNTDYKIAADYDFILRIFKNIHLKFHYVPQVIVKMRIGGASNSSIKNIFQKTREDYRIVRANNTGGVYTVLRKNTSKIKQFLKKLSNVNIN